MTELTASQELEKNKRAVKKANLEHLTSLLISYNLTLDDIEEYLDTPTASEKLSYFNREYTKSETFRAIAAKAQEARRNNAELARLDKEIARLEKELKAVQATKDKKQTSIDEA